MSVRYIQEMPKLLQNTKNQLCLCADDSNLLVSAKTVTDLEFATSIELSKFEKYFYNNNLFKKF